MIRALIVDDETPARERLRALLRGFPDVEVVGEAEDGPGAMERILDLSPRLVFLDIQMPEASGLDVAASLRAPRPHLVFCTAFDEFAVDAFELHALDYILKPVTRARLAKTIARVRALEEDLEESLDRAARSGKTAPRRFLAKHGSRYHVVPLQLVTGFVTEGGLTKLVTAEQHYWIDPPLGELEARLDPQSFHRISRSALVRLAAVREVAPLPGGSGEVILANGLRLSVSRRRFQSLLEKLEAGR